MGSGLASESSGFMNRIFRWNVRNQILSVGLAGLVVLVVAVVYFYNFASNQLLTDSKNLIGAINNQYANSISTTLAERSNTFDGWIRDDVFGLSIEFMTTAELGEEFDRWLAGKPGFALLALVDANGIVLEARGSSRFSSYAQSMTGSSLPDFDLIRNANQNSVRFLQSAALKQAGLESTETYMFYHPARNSEDKENGAFVAILDWSEIDRQSGEFRKDLSELGFETTATMVLFPGERTVVSTSYEGKDDEFGQSCKRAEWSGEASDKRIVDTEIGGTSVLLSAGAIQAPSVADGKTETGSAPLLVSAVPEDEITGQLYSVMFTIGIIAALGAVAVILIAYLIARRMSRNIGRLTEISLRISEGDIDSEIDVSGRDEIGDLAGAYRSLIAYISEMAEAAQRVAAKDFTVEVRPKSTRDVLGSSFKAMTESLSDVIKQIADSTHVLASAASEISSTSEQMTKGARNQADRVAQVSTAIEQMAASIVEASKNSDSAASASKNSSDTAKGGGTVVSETISGMRQISDVIRKSAEDITRLAESVDEIGKIVSVIDDIADQTNLLALNAAIEAARAGEQGRGFAVVADEVRKLAERTGKATGEITSMITGIQKQTDEVVNSMETGIQEVDKGRELADKAGTSLSAVVDMSQKVMEMIQQIAAASQEQSSGAEVVAKNIEDISSIATATASGAEQSAQASAELNKQTEDLKTIVAQFRVKAAQQS